MFSFYLYWRCLHISSEFLIVPQLSCTSKSINELKVSYLRDLYKVASPPAISGIDSGNSLGIRQDPRQVTKPDTFMLSKCKILTVKSIHWHSKEHKPILLVALLQSSWNIQEQWSILSITSFNARQERLLKTDKKAILRVTERSSEISQWPFQF